MAAMLFFLVTLEVRTYILSAMETALTSPILNYLPDFRRRVGLIVTGLLTLLDRNIANRRRDLPLWNHIYRAARRFFDLMDRLAAGRLPRTRRGPHTGGRPHPENLTRGCPFAGRRGWLALHLGVEAAPLRAQLEAVLAEPGAKELLAQVPAAERILRPICRMLGVGRFDPYLDYAREAAEKTAAWATGGLAACLYRRPDRLSRRTKAMLALGLGRKSEAPSADPAAASPPRSPADAPLKCLPFRAARPPAWWYGADPPPQKPP